MRGHESTRPTEKQREENSGVQQQDDVKLTEEAFDQAKQHLERKLSTHFPH